MTEYPNEPAEVPQEHEVKRTALKFALGHDCTQSELSELATFLGFQVQDQDMARKQASNPNLRPF